MNLVVSLLIAGLGRLSGQAFSSFQESGSESEITAETLMKNASAWGICCCAQQMRVLSRP